jgi:type I site-specific restriction endonuclease
MNAIDKKSLSERDICTKFIMPALDRAGWDLLTQVREKVYFTKGRVIVKGKLRSRGEGKRADYVLYFKPNLPIAVIEAKDNNHTVSAGIQQALSYADWFLSRRRSGHLCVAFLGLIRMTASAPLLLCHPECCLTVPRDQNGDPL